MKLAKSLNSRSFVFDLENTKHFPFFYIAKETLEEVRKMKNEVAGMSVPKIISLSKRSSRINDEKQQESALTSNHTECGSVYFNNDSSSSSNLICPL